MSGDAGDLPDRPGGEAGEAGALGEQVVDRLHGHQLGARLAVHVDELREEELDPLVPGSPLHVIVRHSRPRLRGSLRPCSRPCGRVCQDESSDRRGGADQMPIGRCTASCFCARETGQERISQMGARERRKDARIEHAVRGQAHLDLRDMMVVARAGDHDRGLAERSPGLGIERTELLRRRETLVGARDRDPVGESVVARDVRDRDDAAALEVDLPRRERAAEPEGRLDVRRGARNLAQEVRVRSRSAEHRDERGRDREAPADLPEVERDVRADQVRAIGRDQAVLERADPARLRHPPERALREHVVRVRRPATASEAAIDVGGEALEVAVDGGAGIAVRVGEGVLLVGRERELAARRTAEREPRPGHGCRAAPLDGEVDQLGGERFELEREHATDVRR